MRSVCGNDAENQATGRAQKHSGQQNGEVLGDARTRAERDAIQLCLQDSGSNVSRAARDLGVSRMTLYRLMEKHGITP